MENSPQGDGPRNAAAGSQQRKFLGLLGLILLVTTLFLLSSRGPTQELITYDFFLKQLDETNVLELRITETTAEGRFKNRPEAPLKINDDGTLEAPTNADGSRKKVAEHFRVVLPTDTTSRGQLSDLLREHPEVKRTYVPPDNSLMLFYTMMLLLPIVLLLLLWLSNRRREQMMGGGFLSGFTKSPAKRYEGAKQAVTFDDVAGLQGVKEDLMEIVEFLKTPDKFQRLGGRVPKGVLLNGPPGTGKTLLARAVAGEAGVPFYSVNGSEFIQMFVGVGAGRVRDLFRAAKESGPSIVFIDEIDAVGRQRGAGLGGGHDEREQTLNQILSEMDGFSPSDSVIVLAATNRPDVLDPALLRPGRFDRHVNVGRPTHKGRKEIFNVHVRNVPLDNDVDIDSLASATIGMTGADIRNVVNEAALWAARQNKKRVSMADFDYARDKILLGAKREEAMVEEEREKTAYHEAGHTLAAWRLKGADRVRKVTIVPRGRSLGSTHILPAEDRLSVSKSQLLDQLVVALGGRAAERLIYEETTVGAENDLERGTAVARRMVTHWGMSDRLGPVSYKLSDDDPFLGREIHQQRQFSERTMEQIDVEVAAILREAESRAEKLLKERRDDLEKLTQQLIEKEELDEDEITELIGPSVHEPKRQAQRKAAEEAAREKAEKAEQEARDEAQDAARDGGEAGEADHSGGGKAGGRDAAGEDATDEEGAADRGAGRDDSKDPQAQAGSWKSSSGESAASSDST